MDYPISGIELKLYEILEGLHRNWNPHNGQAEIGNALFYQEVKDIFACCGRNFGKSELAIYLTWRYAMQVPGSENYIFLPLQKQGKEIMWAPERLQNFGPRDWIKSINNTEMRITFNNGSFIKVDGSDNVDALRGIKPKGLIIYDELKDHKKAFIDAMEPNRAAHDSPAVFIGTPPEFHNHFDDLMKQFKEDPDAVFFWAPSRSNPHISQKFIDKKEIHYRNANDIETFLREYEALPVRGGKKHIIPQFFRYQTKELIHIIPRDIHKWTMWTIFDPATTSTFGVLFILHNEYTKQFVIVDEIYEQDRSAMTSIKIARRVNEIFTKWKERGIHKFRFVYDEAAAWFSNELTEHEEIPWQFDLEPTKKSKWNEQEGISAIRTVFDMGLIDIASHLEKLLYEFGQYMTDDKGKVPKANDHLLDCLRYFLFAAGYNFIGKDEPLIKDPDMEPRARSLDRDMLEMQPNNSYRDLED